MTDGETGKVGYEINFNRYFYNTFASSIGGLKVIFSYLQATFNRLMDDVW